MHELIGAAWEECAQTMKERRSLCGSGLAVADRGPWDHHLMSLELCTGQARLWLRVKHMISELHNSLGDRLCELSFAAQATWSLSFA